MSICSRYRGCMTTELTPSRTIPARHGSAPAWAERFARPILALAGPGARMHGEELADLSAGLNRRDELADALVRAVREEHTLTMPQVRAALADGVDAVPQAPPALLRLFAHLEDRPDWVDDDLLARGGAA